MERRCAARWRPSASLMLRFIQPAEVLEHHAPLLGRETAQLVPRRVADFWAGAGRAGQEGGGRMDAVANRCVADAVFLLVRLVAGQAAAGIEQLAIQPLLPFDGSGVEPAGIELARQL